ncbi:MAG: U32 family peptidase [Nanoarchaeota archaeon]|nr:U32 family peptidase [Nanoarchaeota archaeon]MBU1631870.1 U32 family peptidase [Nanoarchaeota archaeon]MBU1876075.1 U32 family peptidase [Nanoarchaeota archaeon]
MEKKIELMCPAGSLPNLKAAVSQGADSVYFGLNKFGARAYAKNFNDNYFLELINICKSNDVKTYLTMNTLVKNQELKLFFKQLEFAYLNGLDAVIIQDPSFIEVIKRSFPGLKIHISTQAGIMNSLHANLFKNADRINLARELSKEEIKEIRKNCKLELEMFVHGALCVSFSGSCLFSSFIGGRSGNRGRCAQPCRRKYGPDFFLSTKDLCLIRRIPEIIKLGIDSLKIEGRMRTPYYVAATTSVYRKAIDSYYQGKFEVTKEMVQKLNDAFNREFTESFYSSEAVFNRIKSTGKESSSLEKYEVKVKRFNLLKRESKLLIPKINPEKSQKKRLLVRVYSKEDALKAADAGADVIYFDLFDDNFIEVKNQIKIPLYGITPRIFFDSDKEKLLKEIAEKKPEGLFVGSLGILALNLKIPIHFDYNINCFNDLNLQYLPGLPIISPELSLKELAEFKNKNFAVLVHGKVRLMTMRHKLEKKEIKDEKNFVFKINKIHNGYEVLNEKELGLFNKCSDLLKNGIDNFFVDTDKNVDVIVRHYRNILDGKSVDVSKLKKNYVLGWFFKGVE